MALLWFSLCRLRCCEKSTKLNLSIQHSIDTQHTRSRYQKKRRTMYSIARKKSNDNKMWEFDFFFCWHGRKNTSKIRIEFDEIAHKKSIDKNYFFLAVFSHTFFPIILWVFSCVLADLLACSWKRRPCPTNRIVLSNLCSTLVCAALRWSEWVRKCTRSMKSFFSRVGIVVAAPLLLPLFSIRLLSK